jgi:hypothetical protein
MNKHLVLRELGGIYNVHRALAFLESCRRLLTVRCPKRVTLRTLETRLGRNDYPT